MTTTTAAIAATPTKLRSGDWGARVQGPVHRGDTIRIRSRQGKEWDATVERVIWTGDGVSIVATTSRPRRSGPSGRSTRRSNGWCQCGACEDLMSRGYGHLAGQTIRCPECGGKAEVA